MSDPYVTIHKDDSQIYKSQVYKGNLNPDFSDEKKLVHPVTLQSIASGDKVLFKVKDFNKIISSKLIGQCQFSLLSLMEFDRVDNSESSRYTFKTPDGLACVLTKLNGWKGTLKLINGEKACGELHLEISLKFDGFTETEPFELTKSGSHSVPESSNLNESRSEMSRGVVRCKITR